MQNAPEINNQNGLQGIQEDGFSISGRIAVYDNLKSIPRIIDFHYIAIQHFLDEVPQKTYLFSHELGGRIPYTIIKEVVENLIHANFNEIIITIMQGGNHIIVSDQGPGIENKEKAFLPGYSSATRSMKKYIRGVGSGLPIVRETIIFSGGNVDITDNIKRGTVVSLRIEEGKNTDGNILQSGTGGLQSAQQGAVQGIKEPRTDNEPKMQVPSQKKDRPPEKQKVEEFDSLKLSIRQIKILSLVLELDETGPSKIAKELGFSLSTSYRELIFLEESGLLVMTESGKRQLTDMGKKCLEYYSNSF
jgi:predicted transcriptional regulator